MKRGSSAYIETNLFIGSQCIFILRNTKGFICYFPQHVWEFYGKKGKSTSHMKVYILWMFFSFFLWNSIKCNQINNFFVILILIRPLLALVKTAWQPFVTMQVLREITKQKTPSKQEHKPYKLCPRPWYQMGSATDVNITDQPSNLCVDSGFHEHTQKHGPTLVPSKPRESTTPASSYPGRGTSRVCQWLLTPFNSHFLALDHTHSRTHAHWGTRKKKCLHGLASHSVSVCVYVRAATRLASPLPLSPVTQQQKPCFIKATEKLLLQVSQSCWPACFITGD